MRSENEWLTCRLCMCKQRMKAMVEIFNEENRMDLPDMISEVIGVNVSNCDGLPSTICQSCSTRLISAHSFRLAGQQSHAELVRSLGDEEDTMEGYAEVGETEDSNCKVELIECTSVDFADIIDVDDDYNEESVLGESNTEIFADLKEENESVDSMQSAFFYSEILDNDMFEIEDKVSSSNKKIDAEIGRQTAHKANGTIKKEAPKKGRPIRRNDEAIVCYICGNTYTSQGRLTDHIKSHSGIKPYECEICGHCFAQTQQLSRHMNTHTGNRPYKCQYCPAAFADLSTRNKHHRIHTNERPYKCGVCKKTFSYTNTLKYHLMTHSGEKPHDCKICGKGFQQPYKLRNHLKTHEKAANRAAKLS